LLRSGTATSCRCWRPHRHLKDALGQALLLRGHRDFADLAAFRAFVDAVVGRANAARRRLVEAERPHLAQLPPQRAGAAEETRTAVPSGSTISMRSSRSTAGSAEHEEAVGSVDDAANGNSGTTRTAMKVASSATNVPRRCASRHCHSRPRLTSFRRATSTNFAPGSFSSARIRSLSSDRQFRRRSTPVMISTTPTASALTGAPKNGRRNTRQAQHRLGRRPAADGYAETLIRSRHLRRGPVLVDEHQAVGIEVRLALKPGPAPLQDVQAVLLDGVPCHFLRVIRWRSKRRQIVSIPAVTPALASSAWISARVMSDFCSTRPRIYAA
jgi:hypothetical protein